jgi:amino acid transporter
VENKPEVKKDPSKNIGCWILIVIVVIIFFIILVSNCAGSDNNQMPLEQSSWYTCETFVERVLKSPKTADFEHYNANKVNKIGENIFEVTLYVDAENSFGALIRSTFYCKMNYDGENWTLLDIQER